MPAAYNCVMRRLLPIVIATALPTACGLKGDLYLPPPPAAPPAEAAAAVPGAEQPAAPEPAADAADPSDNPPATDGDTSDEPRRQVPPAPDRGLAQ